MLKLKYKDLVESRWLRWLAPWAGRPALWRWSRHGVALGVALGVFFGLLIPIAQVPVTVAAAIVFRANLPAAAASTLITNPVTLAPIYYVAYRIGSTVTGDTTLPDQLSPDGELAVPKAEERSTWQRIRALGMPLLVGLAVLAVGAGFISYAVVSLLWRGYMRWGRTRPPRAGR